MTSAPDSSIAAFVQRGIRVLVTRNCNFNCLFCHNEGMDKQGTGYEMPVSASLIAEFLRAGVRDLTFSGGEPLLEPETVFSILENLVRDVPREQRQCISISLVTNASLLTDTVVSRLSAFRNEFMSIRVNCSLHSPDPATYDFITGTQGCLSRVRQNILYVVAAGFDVRLNYVLLRGRNTESSQLDAIIADASSMGVRQVKLIELLVTPQNRDEYREYLNLSPLLYNMRHRAIKIEQPHQRTVKLTFEDPPMTVHFVRCACAVGCKDCLSLREIELAPGGCAIGCMMRPPIAYGSTQDIFAIAEAAADQIRSMSREYGSRSPSFTIPPPRMGSKAVFVMRDAGRLRSLVSQMASRGYSEFLRAHLKRRGGADAKGQAEFEHIEPVSETHSTIQCAWRETVSHKGLEWEMIKYLDPVYDFSRTRCEVNHRKIKAMDLVVDKQVQVAEERVYLPPLDHGKILPVLCFETTVPDSDCLCRLELLFTDSFDPELAEIVSLYNCVLKRIGVEV